MCSTHVSLHAPPTFNLNDPALGTGIQHRLSYYLIEKTTETRIKKESDVGMLLTGITVVVSGNVCFHGLLVVYCAVTQ